MLTMVEKRERASGARSKAREASHVARMAHKHEVTKSVKSETVALTKRAVEMGASVETYKGRRPSHGLNAAIQTHISARISYRTILAEMTIKEEFNGLKTTYPIGASPEEKMVYAEKRLAELRAVPDVKPTDTTVKLP